MLIGNLFHREKRLGAGLDLELQFAEDLADYAGGLFVRGK
jgi:hypothetical protein